MDLARDGSQPPHVNIQWHVNTFFTPQTMYAVAPELQAQAVWVRNPSGEQAPKSSKEKKAADKRKSCKKGHGKKSVGTPGTINSESTECTLSSLTESTATSFDESSATSLLRGLSSADRCSPSGQSAAEAIKIETPGSVQLSLAARTIDGRFEARSREFIDASVRFKERSVTVRAVTHDGKVRTFRSGLLPGPIIPEASSYRVAKEGEDICFTLKKANLRETWGNDQISFSEHIES